jgi:hypothetical protein
MWRSLSTLHLCLFALLITAAQAVRETKLYNILSVAPEANEQEIKKAYRKAALCVSSFLHYNSRQARDL